MSKIFQPRPSEIPVDLIAKGMRLHGLAALLQKEAWSTVQAFNSKGFTFPHELDIILTDLERKADQLQTYLRAENYSGRLLRQTDTTEVDSEN